MSIFSGTRPDITPAQLGAALIGGVPVVANLLHAFGVYTISPAEQEALTDTIKYGAGLAAVVILGDAHLRSQRGKADAHVKAAALTGNTADYKEPTLKAPEVANRQASIKAVDLDNPVEELPSDEEEFAAPPGSMPVQPSQVETGQTGQS